MANNALEFSYLKDAGGEETVCSDAKRKEGYLSSMGANAEVVASSKGRAASGEHSVHF